MPLRSRVSAKRRSSSLPCFLRVVSVSKMSISRARCSGNFPRSCSAQSEFETFISDIPPPTLQKNKPTVGFVTEGGLDSLGSISSLLRVLPTHRRCWVATTLRHAAFAELDHFDISIIVRRARKSIARINGELGNTRSDDRDVFSYTV